MAGDISVYIADTKPEPKTLLGNTSSRVFGSLRLFPVSIYMLPSCLVNNLAELIITTNIIFISIYL